jgi:arylsulfatase A-like enzyme
MKITQLFSIVIVVIFTACNSIEKTAPKVDKKKPNVLIIFPDQLRRYAAGFWSEAPFKKHVKGIADPVITPNIDYLAKNGIVFTNAISNYPLCSPYRGMLMSGRYPEQNGIWNNCRVGRNESLRDDITTIPDLFLKAGYNTSYFGKCHWLKNEALFDKDGNYVGTTKAPGGHHTNRYDTYIPPKKRHGIEYFYQALKDEHFNPRIYSNDTETIQGKNDGELHLPKVFSAKNESEKIIAYLQNKKQRDHNKPFCMIWSMNPPHNPWDEANTDMESLHEHYDTDKYPKINNQLVVRQNANLTVADYARHYFANVTSGDKYIGHVISALKESGELNNTIIIFSSDHGEMLGSHSLTGKNVLELESLAIPFIVHWPKGLKAGITDIIMSVPDVLPTVMGLAGISDEIPTDIEGINFAPLLKDPSSTEVIQPNSALIMLGNSRGIQTKRYTFCIEENKKQWDEKPINDIKSIYYYDNQLDPYQLQKISMERSDELSKYFLSTLGKLLQKTNDPWFQSKKYADIILYP